MEKVMRFIESRMMPIAGKVAQQRHLGAIRDAYISFMPFIIVGSILLVISSFPSASYKEFMASIFGPNWGANIEIPFSVIFSGMSLFISFMVAYRLAERYKVDRISAGVLSLSAFMVLTPFAHVEGVGTVIPTEWLGSKGLFVAMIGALLWTEIFRWFIEKRITIKMPDGVPPAVEKSFAALVPATVVLCLALAIRLAFAVTDFNTIHQFIYDVLATPVRSFGTSYFGALMTSLTITLLWSVGINSGSMVNGIMRPVWAENQQDNLSAMANGVTPPHVVTEQFFDIIWMGGAGATLSLIIAILMFARSQHIKKVGKLAAGSSIFNINEPVLFGLPIIMNPIMLIPFNLVPLVLVTLQYVAMSIGLVSTTTGAFIPWTLPPVLSGFIVTASISGAVMQIVNLTIGAMIYLPFLRIIDKQYRSTEVPQETELKTTLETAKA
ncbi:PTS cellobiose transporter subunit IIC [Vibrio scophthalmi]|uniref:Permease IIC component n=2 Tax=Vibrio scophthalmi TaxID=45658 RepID=F9RSK0_9VIBR|nr:MULTISPECIES: PTS cellobiose transporter subunit IIC [Vibrio]EGU32108.1 PTS system lactose/cellobiose family IIC subunit [Vibrio scophthalmi LMG 19158]EGU34071.1 PTS system lactose/cellobiose family IIC subunit [Vibrio sp. N418]MCY9804691.1 PTS cellobiose transporter subunit IIC [Vibrio scophthalmi]ODS12471.1 Cellobiose permease IIC component [Vibrio scophthalmi]